MDSNIIKELLGIYKISDKEEKERKLSEFYKNNPNAKSFILETEPIKLEDIMTDKTKKEQIYVLEDDAFTEDWFERYDLKITDYKSIEQEFDEYLEIYKKDTVFYNPKMCFLLTMNQQISVKKHNENKEENEWELVEIVGRDYSNFYIRGFKKGIKDFEENYGKFIENIHNQKDRDFLINNLYLSVYGDNEDITLKQKGWFNEAFAYHRVIDSEKINNFGFNSGHIYRVNKFYESYKFIKAIIEQRKLDELKNQSQNNNLSTVKTRGRKRIEPKDLSEYFLRFDKERIPNFINALKDEFINGNTKEIIYLIEALKRLGYITFLSKTEIFRAFELSFGKKLGSQQARSKIVINDLDYLENFKNMLIKIKQDTYTH